MDFWEEVSSSMYRNRVKGYVDATLNYASPIVNNNLSIFTAFFATLEWTGQQFWYLIESETFSFLSIYFLMYVVCVLEAKMNQLESIIASFKENF